MDRRLYIGVQAGLKRGWSGYLWLMKILTPISLGTALLIHSGGLSAIDFLIEPAMGLFSLPASAAIPLIAGLFTGIYGAVGAMSALTLTPNEMTLIAIFLLISHNIIQESMVQGQSGLNAFVAAAFRLTMSVIVTFMVSLYFQPDATTALQAMPDGVTGVPALSTGAMTLQMAQESVAAMAATATTSTAAAATQTAVTATASTATGATAGTWAEMLIQWGHGFLLLALQIFCIIMPLMVVLETLKALDLIRFLVKATAPILRLMGLSRATGVLWLTAAVFGLTYGAAVIVEETRHGSFSKDELTRLHLSIGINHAMIEDPALFLPLGISPFWLWIPRLTAAIAAIYLILFINAIRRFHAGRTGHKKLCHHR